MAGRQGKRRSKAVMIEWLACIRACGPHARVVARPPDRRVAAVSGVTTFSRCPHIVVFGTYQL